MAERSSRQGAAAPWARLAAFLLIVLAAAAIALVWSQRGTKNPPDERDTDEAFLNALAPLSASELQGTILAVADGAVTLDVPVVAGVAAPKDASLRRRSVRISAATELFDRREKTAEERERERRERGTPLVLPFSLTPLAASALREGDTVRVSAGGGNIKLAPEIEATHLIRMSSPF